MSASVYTGESRALVRAIVLLFGARLAVTKTVVLSLDTMGVHSIKNAQWLLRLPFEFRPLAVMLGALALWGVVQVARRRSPVRWGIITTCVLMYMKESATVLTGFESWDDSIAGGVFLAWIFGIAFARELDRRMKRASTPTRDDAFGEAAATGMFAAVYVGAGTSKLLSSGLSWTEGSNLLATIVSRHTFPANPGLFDRYLDFLIAHPGLATVFAMATLGIQLGAVLYLVSPPLRMVWGTLIVGFHFNVWVLMGVRYFEPMLFALVASYPWPAILRRLRGQRSGAAAVTTPAESPSMPPPAILRATVRTSLQWVVVTLGVSIAAWLALRDITGNGLFENRGIDLRARRSGDVEAGFSTLPH